MRRFSLVALAVASAFAVSACDSSSTSASAAGASQTEKAASVDFASLNSLKGFSVGKGASAVSLPTAYVLFDPQCPHCAALWNAAKPLQDRVQLKWIPVGILNGVSNTQAAMLIEAADPIQMMETNEAVISRTGRPSSVTESVKDETRSAVDDNTKMLRTIGAQSVPTLVYRNPETKQLATVSGAMPTEKLAELLGLNK
jgi:thiol:disulfide interchange protein DsbG